ncbi:hypothetical protein [Frigoriglobus tundricola]|uniref:Uncharacterized protein n=1 Tax=Frigoriglobus tundricola TaxID=2774151 RepID=A0A6M5YLT7_9BACT|nr:hypothetical protein [Frigoriglobus tundricola]QJW94286.1 hypothetical protein FTUN_1806 [Frigoriglobus tundricola]
MTAEARAWATSAKPERMLELYPPGNDRKGRLLLVACCRACWDFLAEGSQQAVAIGERWTDGLADARKLEDVCNLADYASVSADERYQEIGNDLRMVEVAWRGGPVGLRLRQLQGEHERQTKVLHAAMAAHAAVSQRPDAGDFRRAVQLLDPQLAVELLRDIFGNPFRPVTFSPLWRTDNAVSLAHTIDESREFGAMPILADALQDAGCDSADILDHCRNASLTHVRGCWVVDLVLGKQ